MNNGAWLSVAGRQRAGNKLATTTAPPGLSALKTFPSARLSGGDCSSCSAAATCKVPPQVAPKFEGRAFIKRDTYPPPPTFLPGSWSKELEKHHNLPLVEDILDEKEIAKHLDGTRTVAKDRKRVKEILQNAWDRALLKGVKANDSEFVQGLTVEETATLLNVDVNDRDLMELLFSTALKIKERIYGNRIVLFSPLYLANYCNCSCLYCGYRAANKSIARSSLSDEELVREVESLQRQGHRRLLLLTGESPKYTFEQLLNALRITSEVRTPPHGSIRRINLEVPALSVSDVRRLKQLGVIGTNTLFQETYHRPTYKKMHPTGPKAHFQHRLQSMDRTQIGGIDDCGIGALFGLYDYRYEVLAMLQHARHLDKTYGAGPHTISIPRLRPAHNAPASSRTGFEVSDMEFRKLVAVLRCAVPYTGMILSTRESVPTRRAVLRLGVSQMSAGSRTTVGAYSKESANRDSEDKREIGNEVGHGQFTLSDGRNLDEVVHDLMADGFMPSFCTACYRCGRTGRTFMSIAKRGDIGNLCGPNAAMTLAEYLADYASPETKNLGMQTLDKERQKLGQGARRALDRNLKKILEQDVRDIYI